MFNAVHPMFHVSRVQAIDHHLQGICGMTTSYLVQSCCLPVFKFTMGFNGESILCKILFPVGKGVSAASYVSINVLELWVVVSDNFMTISYDFSIDIS